MKKRILVVDDSRSILRLVSLTLKGGGFQTTEATDGQTAFELAKKQAFDLVLTDMNMPHMDGLTLTQKLRFHPNYHVTPILMLTAESGNTCRTKGETAGVTDWLAKPFDPKMLLAAVKKLTG